MIEIISIIIIITGVLLVIYYFNIPSIDKSEKKITWATDKNEIHFTYSKDEYDRKYLDQYYTTNNIFSTIPFQLYPVI